MINTLQTVHVAAPRFSTNQTVRFLGGCGTIKDYRSDSGTWTYAVEMEMGPEPDVGRIGLETTVLLHESDIQDMMH
jgi:hypothetical protein